MYRFSLHLALLGLFLCGVWAGCNVFDGIGENPDSDDPQVLLHNAQSALDRGEPSVAVEYLERAFELDPSDPEIRIELTGARFAVAGVDLITLKGLIEHINGETGIQSTMASSRRRKSNGVYCTFDEDRDALDVFDYTSTPEYQQLQDDIETFVQARDLLDGIRLADRERLTDALRAKWYLLRAFTRIVLAIDAINAEVERIDATLYRVPDRENSIGICAASREALDAAKVHIRCDLLPRIIQGLDELRQRSELLDDAEIGGVLADLERAVDVVGTQLDINVIRFCSAIRGGSV